MSKCELWTGPTDGGGGYGRFWFGGKEVGMHRFIYELVYGPIPKTSFCKRHNREGRTCVCHYCDIPPCVNPEHLFIGTACDNINDCQRKGRHPNPGSAGEHNGRAKLTERKVRKIRSDKRILRLISKDYGISQNQVSYIKNRKQWSFLRIEENKLSRFLPKTDGSVGTVSTEV